MKNISLNIDPNSITSLAPPPPCLPGNPSPTSIPKQVTSVLFSAQFDDEYEAMKFASFIIDQINEFKERD